MLYPVTGFFPQISHTLAIALSSEYSFNPPLRVDGSKKLRMLSFIRNELEKQVIFPKRPPEQKGIHSNWIILMSPSKGLLLLKTP
jgi:hypothetical protein